ncbi:MULTISPECIES: hypothetical protein [unclassified Rhizobium]|uniref:hypothetical protein n=1 Tax=unclassified Rhizobium TaxID=2613769 RepID=UPI001614C712|nr:MULTISPECIES: hypothetical protein [unclassified Rhizobium]MBB3319039.1 hypothetical protein [Rhizobium sp. BK181]MBB3544123.1 hypothetical protein [Rhizobium sp. BK399]MCS4094689.1 hypothetical protein [Rhizobium sp. BK176]
MLTITCKHLTRYRLPGTVEVEPFPEPTITLEKFKRVLISDASLRLVELNVVYHSISYPCRADRWFIVGAVFKIHIAVELIEEPR